MPTRTPARPAAGHAADPHYNGGVTPAPSPPPPPEVVTDLPKLAGVRHRSLFILKDIYVHYVEMDEEFSRSVDTVRDHSLFQEISKKLLPYIEPYDPNWKGPKDATAREFYSWDAPA